MNRYVPPTPPPPTDAVFTFTSHQQAGTGSQTGYTLYFMDSLTLVSGGDSYNPAHDQFNFYFDDQHGFLNCPSGFVYGTFTYTTDSNGTVTSVTPTFPFGFAVPNSSLLTGVLKVGIIRNYN